jgi:hypothetical protein
MRYDLFAILYFLLALAFALCTWRYSHFRPLWTIPTINVFFLTVTCIQLMLKNQDRNLGFLTAPKYIWTAFFLNIASVMIYVSFW